MILIFLCNLAQVQILCVCAFFFLFSPVGCSIWLSKVLPEALYFQWGGAFEVPVDTTVEGAQPCPQPDSLQTHALLCFVFSKKGSVKARWEILK